MINLILEIIFVLLVALDTIFALIIIKRGWAVEIGGVAKYYIHNQALTLVITIVCVAALIAWLEFVNMVWVLAGVNIYMAWHPYRKWRQLK